MKHRAALSMLGMSAFAVLLGVTVFPSLGEPAALPAVPLPGRGSLDVVVKWRADPDDPRTATTRSRPIGGFVRLDNLSWRYKDGGAASPAHPMLTFIFSYQDVPYGLHTVYIKADCHVPQEKTANVGRGIVGQPTRLRVDLVFIEGPCRRELD